MLLSLASCCTEDTVIAGVAELQSSYTQYAVDLMVKQMKSPDYTVETLVDSNGVVISYKERSHTVSPEAGKCSCTFQQTLLMLCRHIFKYCDHCGDVMFKPSLVS